MNTYTAIHNADTLKMYNGIPTHSASNWSLPTIPMGQNFTGVPVTVMNQSGKKFLLIQISGFVKPQEPRYVWTGDVRLVNSVSTVRSASSNFSNATGDGKQSYTFNQDFDANGTNVIPPMGGGANFQLKYHFKKGDVFEGEILGGEVNPKNPSAGASPTRLVIYTPNAQKPDGSAWGGSAVFQVPLNVVGATSVSSAKSGSTGSTPFVWTPAKKVIGAVLAIGAVFGILKLTKVI